MEHGSKHVWVYSDCSDDEYVSEAELEEGMWLSCSEESDHEEGPPPKLTPEAAVMPPPPGSSVDLEVSTTKYLPPEDSDTSPDDDTDDTDDNDDDDNDQATMIALNEPQASGGRNSSDNGKAGPKTVHYADLVVPKAKKGGKKGKKKPSVEYAQIQQQQQVILGGSPPPAPPPPPSARRGVVVSSPPLPPPPIKGIMKNRLNSQRLKRVKKARITPVPSSTRTSASSYSRPSRGRMVRRSDTNVLAVKFNKLIEPSDVHTGDPVVCSNSQCSAVLSHLSTTSKQDDKDELVWVCEYCGVRNEVDVVKEELPTKGDTTFLVSPPPTVGGGAGVEGGAGMEEALVVFCIDISGSMCVTTEVPGKFELKGHDRVKELSSLNVNNEDQYFPRQRRDVTYVSRLQSVQAAVDFQLGELAKTNPSQRVALITFNDEVTIIGDGRADTLTLAGDKLWNSDSIVKVGSEVPLPAAVSKTNKALSERVFKLEESGQTALGPALLVSISMAARVPGSKVIICTDGLANKGVGNLDGLSTAEDRAAAQTFYEDMGTLAVEKNVMVSLVRIKGTDCKALELGQVADKTGGEVTTVDPLNITTEFSSILANPVIATNVKTKIILHGQLYFRTEDRKESVLVIPVGNVTAETELTYEYGVRNTPKKSSTASKNAGPSPPPDGAVGGASPASDDKVPPMTVDGKPHLPFQLQIEYTGRDGSRCLRVITEAKPMTKDRTQAERDIRMGVIGTHVAHTTAKLAMDGEYTSARLNAFSCQRLLQRSSHTSAEHRIKYSTVMEDIIPLENVLKTKQKSERDTYGRQYSDEEEFEEEFYDRGSELLNTPLALTTPSSSAASAPSPRKAAAPKKKKAISRRQDISDDLATYCYNMKKQNY